MMGRKVFPNIRQQVEKEEEEKNEEMEALLCTSPPIVQNLPGVSSIYDKMSQILHIRRGIRDKLSKKDS